MHSTKQAAALVSTALLVTSLFMLHAPAAQAADQQWEQTSTDGLQLTRTLPYGAIYMKPGATFEQYKRLALLDCFVQFAKDWQRNYNQNEPDLEMQVSQGDMNRIKTELAAEFKRVFTQELQTDGGYEIVDIAAPDVLILRPAILNLIVNAPEIDTAPPMSGSVVASAGQMTLYLELWDSTTNKILARVIDTEADQGQGGLAEAGNSVGNKEAADRILKNWADRLRKALETARTEAPGPAAPAPAAAPAPGPAPAPTP
jgi:hypothetical protein